MGSSCTGWAIFQPMGSPTHPFYLDYYVFFGDFGCPTPSYSGDFQVFSTENGVFRQPYKFAENRFAPSILRRRDGRNCGGPDPPVSTKSEVFLSQPFFLGSGGAT